MIKESTLREYFNKEYQGSQSFLNEVIFPIFGEDNFDDGYETERLDDKTLLPLAKQTGIKSIKEVGRIGIGIEQLYIFDITVTDRVLMERNRVNIQQVIRRLMEAFSSAFMIFHYEGENKWDWRFTYCHKGKDNKEVTDSKRFTFLLGPNESCRTAALNFMKLAEKAGELKVSDISDAFSVETLSKEFFEKYKKHYEKFVCYITGKKFEKEGGKFVEKSVGEPHPTMYRDFGYDDRKVRDYIKQLLGRITLLHFVQKKGWLGVPEGGNWGEGDKQFLQHLFTRSTAEQKADFLDAVLEPLYNEALDADRSADNDLYDTKVNLSNGSRVRIPYLSGGLFERTNPDRVISKFPAEYFEDLFDFFSQYNFTIDENDPNEAQVGVDPEMMGRIFENLLEDNKDKGAFYTPKEIVRYMCQQSLIAYLQTDVEDETIKEKINRFVQNYDVKTIGGKDSELAKEIDQKLKDVKICDPAIGSGAFPMGLLKELFMCRGAIEEFDDAANIKRHIIQQNIYGVDIERGAVDIARLRFWLSLVLEEKAPTALPNLDYKIMQGNSLLESYKGQDLSNIMANKPKPGQQLNMEFAEEAHAIQELQADIRAFYNCKSHDVRLQLRENISTHLNDLLKAKGFQIEEHLEAQNDQFFLWHTWFDDVFSRPSKQGFDIVIGNPPYVQLQGNGGELAKLYEKSGYETFARTGDIYCLFYELGYNMLRDKGNLCFITSNTWMRAAYGSKTRDFFCKKTNAAILIDFAGMQLFENATVETNILLFSKEKYQGGTRCFIANKETLPFISELKECISNNNTICSFKISESWVILSPIEQRIKEKIEKNGKPLKDWDIEINFGIKTGFNEAFIISTEKKDEILRECKTEEERTRTAEIIRPVLRGRDIQRYSYNWANLWVICTYFGIHEVLQTKYPTLFSYLETFKVPLQERGQCRYTSSKKVNIGKSYPGQHHWLELDNNPTTEKLDDFSRPKLVWKRIGSILRFSYDRSSNIVLDSTCFAIGSHIEYLCCFLNSIIGQYLLKDSPKTGTGDLIISVQALQPIRVPYNTTIEDQLIEMLHNQIKSFNKNVDNTINDLFFSLYGFNNEEVEYIKTSV